MRSAVYIIFETFCFEVWGGGFFFQRSFLWKMTFHGKRMVKTTVPFLFPLWKTRNWEGWGFRRPFHLPVERLCLTFWLNAKVQFLFLPIPIKIPFSSLKLQSSVENHPILSCVRSSTTIPFNPKTWDTSEKYFRKREMFLLLFAFPIPHKICFSLTSDILRGKREGCRKRGKTILAQNINLFPIQSPSNWYEYHGRDSIRI